MRLDQKEFTANDTVILAIGPDDPETFRSYWSKENIAFLGLPDPEHSVLKLYGQQVNLFKLGRQPAQMIIDKKGIIRYVHYGHSMKDIPPNEDMIRLINEINNYHKI